MYDPMKLPPAGSVVCNDSRPCFAKEKYCRFDGAVIYKCRLLNSSYPNDGECPFCKIRQDVTNGVIYPYDYDYAYPKKKGSAAC